MGHSVDEAAAGEAALEQLRAGQYDVLCTDLGMPGMSGWELVRRARRIDGCLATVLITGWGDQIDPGAINQFKGANLARDKPWSPEAEAMDRRRGRLITMMRWLLSDDEALILEFEAYDGFWMITSEAIFGNSMDFLYRPVSYTPSRTAVDSDGKIRLVLAKEDPGFSNWIDNQGYSSGVLTFRNVRSVAEAPRFRASPVQSGAYCAPELLRDDLGPVTIKANVYALGGILYHLLAGSDDTPEAPDTSPDTSRPTEPVPVGALPDRVSAGTRSEGGVAR